MFRYLLTAGLCWFAVDAIAASNDLIGMEPTLAPAQCQCQTTGVCDCETCQCEPAPKIVSVLKPAVRTTTIAWHAPGGSGSPMAPVVETEKPTLTREEADLAEYNRLLQPFIDRHKDTPKLAVIDEAHKPLPPRPVPTVAKCGRCGGVGWTRVSYTDPWVMCTACGGTGRPGRATVRPQASLPEMQPLTIQGGACYGGNCGVQSYQPVRRGLFGRRR